MNRIFDAISLFQLPVGFLVGLVVLLMLELVGMAFWGTAGVLIAVMLLYFAWSYLADRVSFNVFDWFLSKKDREMNARIDARDRKIGRYAFPLGVVLAFIAAQFWSPLEISQALF